MELAKATPEQFGLAVRSHPESLIVTARNKMGTGRELPVKVSLAGKLVETTRIRVDHEQLDGNRLAGKTLVQRITASGQAAMEVSRGILYSGVPVEVVRDFLLVFRADAADPLTDPRLLADYIDARALTELSEWDVLFASAQKVGDEPDHLAGITMQPFGRAVGELDLRQGVLAISGASRRVGSPGDERVGLAEAQIDEAISRFREERIRDGKPIPNTLPPRIFCEIPGRRPLIILRFVDPTIPDHLQAIDPGNILAWSICFPPSAIEGGTVAYIFNTVRVREMFGEDTIEEEAVGDAE